MSSAFSFGFSGDDIDESENNVEVKDKRQHLGQPSHQASSEEAAPVLQEATKIELDDITTQQTRKINFILADYNAAVLSLVTLPNILLTWYTCCKNPEAESESELQIDSALLDSFRHDLSARGISLSFISGGWSPRFVDLIAPESNAKSLNNTHQTFILASETIYSPTYLRPFAETLTGLLRRRTRPVSGPAQNKARTRALVAAKKVYFGVGGGVDEFLETLKEIGGEDMHTQEVTMVLDQGVVRVVLEITV
ncbi:hypothetical protein CISG_04371 [Coccidioides immitis RMSCC 3703]|uniref:Uncharacterized protein n=1 Tax=Coccidioides immitis RMSCC 3703 TaxID=454286 RepID=A0A0J8QR22_COCIT|nr:hypothetical protein CISG_04371 [Coccidioides immitis RMSCC 3703]